MELLDAQLRHDPAAVRVRVPRQLAAALDGSVDRQSVEGAPLAWCLVALQYNKATVAKVFKLLCASGRVAQCGAIVAAAAHQPEEVTVRKSLMLLLRACCVQAHEEAEAGVRGGAATGAASPGGGGGGGGGGAAVARRIVCAVAQQLSLDQARTSDLPYSGWIYAYILHLRPGHPPGLGLGLTSSHVDIYISMGQRRAPDPCWSCLPMAYASGTRPRRRAAAS